MERWKGREAGPGEGLGAEGREFLKKLPGEHQLVGTLHSWALERYGAEAFPAAWKEFTLFEERPMDPMEEPELSSIFMAWSVLHWVPKHHKFPPQPVAQHYLAAQGERLEPGLRAFLQKALRTPYRFFQILAYQARVELRLLDLFLDREVVIQGPQFLVPLGVGEIFFSLLLPVQGKDCLFSSAPTRLQPQQGELLLEYKRDWEKRAGTLDEARLLRHGIELRSLYYAGKKELEALAKLPRNSDGEDFVPLRADYSLECPLGEALEGLLPLSGEESYEQLLKHSCKNPESAYPLYRFPLLRKGGSSRPDWESTTIGWVELEGEFLQVYANSEERAEGIHEDITHLLGERVLYTGLQDLDPEAYRERMADVPGTRGYAFWEG
ncbi:MAG TPA: hypothetical protein ENK02_05215 [Planctomycetes bacterium]|nr:hypothetical protein [Planctomycetota bacterium]